MPLHHLYAPTLAAASLAACAATAPAVTIVNPGFEDTAGQSAFNEFTFGTPAGWAVHNPAALDLTPGNGVYLGTLQPNGTVFFNQTAPEGDRVAILFNAGLEGQGEYGFVQTLGEALQPHTQYTLTVAVGNIASGTAQDGTAYDLSDFPGYRIDLLAGGSVIASDNNSLTIAEGAFAMATVQFTTGDTPPPGLIGIRLVNLNLVPAGHTPADSPDLEVDFDDVALTASPIPEPATLLLTASGLIAIAWRRR